MEIWNHRRPLRRTYEQLQQGTLRVGFLGGSITDARPMHNWPEPTMSWFVREYPDVRFSVENAAIGATGSDLAVFRTDRDILQRGCDLVFVEYAVNDRAVEAERRLRTREGVLRKLLAAGTCDVVLTYTFSQDMYAEMARGDVPDSIVQLEQLADHYGLGSVWMGQYALQEVKQGRMRWEEWLPDGLHPKQAGSAMYGESVIQFLRRELTHTAKRSPSAAADTEWVMPAPLSAAHWGDAYLLPLDKIQTEGPWLIRRWPILEWIDQVLDTAAVGAKLQFSFSGRGLAFGFDFGKLSAEFRYRIDDGEWQTSSRPRPNWCAEQGWLTLYTISDELPAGEHQFELEVVHGDQPDVKGTNFRLAFVGIIPA